jgi:hypothetical protein
MISSRFSFNTLSPRFAEAAGRTTRERVALAEDLGKSTPAKFRVSTAIG